MHTKVLLHGAINASDIHRELLQARTQEEEEEKVEAERKEEEERTQEGSPARRIDSSLLSKFRCPPRWADIKAPGDSIECRATRTEGKCLLRRARRTQRDAEEDRDDAGRSNCETGGPITGPEITGPVPRPPDP